MSVVKMLQKQKLLSFTLLLFTLSIGILIGTLMTRGVSAQKGQGAPDATPLTIPNPVQLSTAFSQLAKKLEPSVVNISTTYLGKQTPSTGNRRRQQSPQTPQDPEDLLRRFFGESPQMMETPRRDGTGSGVIVDPNGYILTNNHVVDEADRIQVHLTGDPVGTDYDAKLIGVDPETDLALIKVDVPKKLAAAKIGNSDAVQVGDWAVAIGSPFGLEATVTAGIISAKGRDIPDPELGLPRQFQHFLQTDAAINPGNSGGPLLNVNGEVIGINTAIATSTRGYQGVGFALPINTAVSVYNQIIKTGRMTRGSIGVSLDTASKPELLKVYGASQGAFVSSVKSGSPADKAGLKEGDVVVAFNGKPITRSDDLVNSAAEAPVGSRATLGVVRDGKRLDLPVTIGDRSEIYPEIAGTRPSEAPRGGRTESTFGMDVRNVEEPFIGDYAFPEKAGVLVESVVPSSFAEDIGLRPNDVITAINRQPVRTVDDLTRIQSTLKPGDDVAFRVLRPPLGAFGARSGRTTTTWQSIYPAGKMPRK